MASYVYDSNDSYPFSSADYGFVYGFVESTEDYGAINVSATEQESYDSITVVSTNDTAFGFTLVNGSASYWKPKKYFYSSSSDNLYTEEDAGLITDSVTLSDDYGTLTAPDGITSREDRYRIDVSQTILAMEPGYAVSTSGATYSFTANTPDNTQLFEISGALISKVVFTWVGSGSLFEIGGGQELTAFNWVGSSGPLRLEGSAVERVATSYTFDAVQPFYIFDYGALSETPSNDLDYGRISLPLSEGEKDYGSIRDTQEITPFGLYEIGGTKLESFAKGDIFGTGAITLTGEVVLPLAVSIIGNGFTTLSGASAESNTESYVGTGAFDTLSGAAESTGANPPENIQLFSTSGSAVEKFRVNPPEDFAQHTFSGAAAEKFVTQGGESTQLFALSGAAVEKNTESYVGVGNLPVVGALVEKATYDYVAELADVSDTSVDYGLIIDAVTETEYYGPITSAAITFEDNRYLTSDYYNLVGAALSEVYSANTPENTQIFTVSGAAIVKATPRFIASGSQTLSGAGVEKNTEVYIGLGSFSSFSGAAESVTYRYSFDSVEVFNIVDYGSSLLENPTTELDYGFITEYWGGGEYDYGFIRNNETVTPYGLWTTSGFAVDSFSKQIVEIGGTIILTGEVVLPLAVSIIGNGNVSIDVSSVEKNTESYVGTGSFGSLSGAAEAFGANPPENIQLFTTSGNAAEKFRANPPEDFALYTFSGAAAEKFVAQTPEDTVLFDIAGSAVERNTESYVGTGTLFEIVDKVEKFTYDYTVEQATVFALDDYGDVRDSSTSSEDYGLITQSVTEFVSYNGIVRDYLKLYGYAAEKFEAQTPENTQLFQTSGNSIEKFTAQTPENTVTFTYDVSSIEKNTESYVGIGETTIDVTHTFKFVPNWNGAGFAFTAGGSAEVSGSNPPENIQLFQIYGAAIAKTTPKFFGSGTVNVDIESTERAIKVWIGTGNAFSFGDGSEARTYVYDETTIVDFTELDYGFISAQYTADVDFGFITQYPQDVDYGTVKYVDAVYPFGSVTLSGSALEAFSPQTPENTQIFTVSGSALESYTESYTGAGTETLSGVVIEKNTEVYIGTGSIAALSGAAESTGANPPENIQLFLTSGTAIEKFRVNPPEDFAQHTFFGAAVEKFVTQGGESTQLLTLNGAAVERNTESYVGTGTLFEIVDKIESRSFSYVALSPDTPATILTETYDDITQTANSREDYGLITNSVTVSEDYGITDNVEFILLKGTADESFNKGLYTASGSATFGGVARVKQTPKWIGSGTIIVTGIGTVPVSVAEVGAGSIAALSGAAESTGANPPENIQLFTYSGFSVEKNTESYVGTGSTSIDVTHTMRFVPNWIGSGNISVDIESNESNTEVYIGLGSAFTFIDSDERVTFDYTAPLAVIEHEYRNFINQATTSSEDYGLITNAATEVDVWGTTSADYINITPTSFVRLTPREFGSGTLSATGSAVEKFTTQAGEDTQLFTYTGTATEKNTEVYIGLGTEEIAGVADTDRVKSYIGSGNFVGLDGSIFFIGYYPYTDYVNLYTSGEGSYTLIKQWNGSGETTIDIDSTKKHVNAYVGDGSIFNIGGGAESITYVYNQDVIVGFVEKDYGAISESPTVDIDYGNILGITTGGLQDYGFIRYDETVNPYGTYQIVGNAYVTNTESYVGSGLTSIDVSSIEKNTESYVGTGSVGALAGAAEAFGANPPENTQLFQIAGVADTRETSLYTFSGATDISIDVAKIEKNTESYVGIGYAEIDITSTEKNTESYFGTGSTSIDVTSVEKNSEVYIGTGSIAALSGAAESTGANPPENIQLFIYSGAAVEKNTESYVGVGSTSIDITSTEKNTESYVGFGFIDTFSGAAEAFAVNLPENVQLFSLSGVSENRFISVDTFYSGGGTINLTNAAITLISVRNYTVIPESILISGVAVEKNTEAFVGSGEVFSFNGSAESRTINPEEDIVLYTFVGAASDIKHTESYVGVGTETISGIAVEKNTEAYYGVGTETIGGVALESNTEVYIGYASFGTLSGAAESTGANPPENIQLFTITGFSTERNTESYVGLGTQTISGTATEKNTEYYVGSGSISTFSGAAEAYGAQTPENTVLYTFTGSATERFVANTPENTQLFSISGAAVERNTEAYYGAGAATLSGVALESNAEVYIGAGTATLSGIAEESFTPVVVGSGTLFTFVGSAEAFGANPPENIQLFTLTGAAINTISYAESGVGTAYFNGVADTDRARSFVGSGSLFNFTGASESFGANPPENIQLFSISGAAAESNTETYFNPFTFPITYRGYGTEKNTESYVGFGSVSLSGIAQTPFSIGLTGSGSTSFAGSGSEKVSIPQIGFGSIAALSGAAESTGANPPENIQLFVVSGSATEKNTESYVGSGSATLSGDAIEQQLQVIVGSGSIVLFSGAAESTGANPPENTQLFSISGSVVERNTESYIGSGSENITGSATEKNTEIYIGSGLLSSISGAAESTTSNPPENTVIFTFAGSITEKHTESYVGDFAEYSISGNATERNTEAFNGSGVETLSGNGLYSDVNIVSGSGSLFAVGGAAESTGAQPTEDTVIFTFTGSSTEKNTESYRGSGNFSKFGGSAESKTTALVSTGLFSISGASSVSETNVYEGHVAYAVSGFSREEFIPGAYRGRGKIVISGDNTITVNNPYRPPRTYVAII